MMQLLKFLKGLLFLNCALYVQGALCDIGSHLMQSNLYINIFKMKINDDNQKLGFSPVCNHHSSSTRIVHGACICVYYVYICMPHYLSVYDFQDTCTETST